MTHLITEGKALMMEIEQAQERQIHSLRTLHEAYLSILDDYNIICDAFAPALRIIPVKPPLPPLEDTTISHYNNAPQSLLSIIQLVDSSDITILEEAAATSAPACELLIHLITVEYVPRVLSELSLEIFSLLIPLLSRWLACTRIRSDICTSVVSRLQGRQEEALLAKTHPLQIVVRSAFIILHEGIRLYGDTILKHPSYRSVWAEVIASLDALERNPEVTEVIPWKSAVTTLATYIAQNS